MGRLKRLVAWLKGRRVHVSRIARRRIALGAASALLVAGGVGTGVAIRYASMLDRIVNPTSTSATEEQIEATKQDNTQLAARVASEGCVLLKNDADATGRTALPIPRQTTKVNVFGWASTAWIGGGSGSGGVTSTPTGLLEALRGYGIEYNEELSGMYESFQGAREFNYTLHSSPEESSRLYEPSIDDERYYSKQLLADARSFSDTAIVVIGRLAGESNDLPMAQYKRVSKGAGLVRDVSRRTLALSEEEEGLLAYVGKTYEHVVVVLNTGNVMELGQLEAIGGIDACLLAGYTGSDGASAIPQVLWGDIDPSGRTTDTWSYDLSTAASYANSGKWGVGSYQDSEGLYPNDGTAIGNLGAPRAYGQVSYVDYAEGPYVGYRWYETADAEGFWAGESNGHGQGYDAVVQYPFGYGLSYTSFSWEVVEGPDDGEALSGDDAVRFVVRVTNTGQVAGRDVVQLYASHPYVAGQIEKPSVELAAYAKTGVLAPGDSQELTLEVSMRDLASYDSADANANGFVGYELDAGQYGFSLRHDAHTPDASAGASVTCIMRRGAEFPTDAVTGAEVTNRFTGESAAAGAGIDGVDTGQQIRYLTRADFSGTFPRESVRSREMDETLRELNLYTAEEAIAWSQEQKADAVRMSAPGRLKVERNGKLTGLGRTLGSDFNDPQWEDLLDQLDEDQALRLVCDAYSGTSEVKSLGKRGTRDADGPSQIGGFTGFNAGTGFPCPWVLSQSWDAALAREVGRAIGHQAAQLGYDGWYAPAANLHRSPVGGRNYEYCSEDPLIAGDICGNMVAGAGEAGVYCYVKHLIANDGEAYIYRDGVYTWLSEQTLRELYLKPFQLLVERYGATGMMTSYNRLGAVWAGGSHALLTSVLREEWGFHGAVITDYSDHPAYMNGDAMLRAGGDLWMAGTKLAGDTDSAAYRAELRRVAKDVLWTQLSARVSNERYVEQTGDTAMERPSVVGAFPVWKVAVGAIDAVAFGLWALALCSWLRERGRLRTAAGPSQDALPADDDNSGAPPAPGTR